jgi:hypothetical protein
MNQEWAWESILYKSLLDRFWIESGILRQRSQTLWYYRYILQMEIFGIWFVNGYKFSRPVLPTDLHVYVNIRYIFCIYKFHEFLSTIEFHYLWRVYDATVSQWKYQQMGLLHRAHNLLKKMYGRQSEWTRRT